MKVLEISLSFIFTKIKEKFGLYSCNLNNRRFHPHADWAWD